MTPELRRIIEQKIDDQLALAQTFIDLLDRLDGDPDIELDPAEDGIADIDGFMEQITAHGRIGVVG